MEYIENMEYMENMKYMENTEYKENTEYMENTESTENETKIIKNFYENADEDKRISREPLEFLRTKKIISRYL